MRFPWNRLVMTCLALAGAVYAQEKDSWNGIKVVTRYARPLRGEDRIVEAGTRFRVYTVKKVEDERVMVSSGEVEGWFYAGEVVPLKDAVAANRLHGSIDELVAAAEHFFATTSLPAPMPGAARGPAPRLAAA